MPFPPLGPQGLEVRTLHVLRVTVSTNKAANSVLYSFMLPPGAASMQVVGLRVIQNTTATAGTTAGAVGLYKGVTYQGGVTIPAVIPKAGDNAQSGDLNTYLPVFSAGDTFKIASTQQGNADAYDATVEVTYYEV